MTPYRDGNILKSFLFLFYFIIFKTQKTKTFSKFYPTASDINNSGIIQSAVSCKQYIATSLSPWSLGRMGTWYNIISAVRIQQNLSLKSCKIVMKILELVHLRLKKKKRKKTGSLRTVHEDVPIVLAFNHIRITRLLLLGNYIHICIMR